MRFPSLAAVGLLAPTLLVTGCADFQFNLAVSSTAAVLKKGSKSLDMESDVELAREALPGTIKTIDSFAAAAPDNPVFLELTSQAYVQYAFGFLEPDIEALPDGDPHKEILRHRATGLYDRGRVVGLHLAQVTGGDKDFETEWKSNPEKALSEVKKEAAPGLYWAGLALASAINLHRDDVDRIAELPKARMLLERAHALDPDYYNHGAALALGVLLSAQAKAMGGDPDKAKTYFEEAINGTGGKFLMAKVLYARFYAVITQDRALFEKTLKDVIATPTDIWPEQRLANELAHRRAETYLKQVEDLF